MTTVSPARTPAACTALPHPVGTPQPTSAATSKGRSSGIGMTEYSLTTAYWEKVPSTHRPPKSSPPWWNRNVPSANSPVAAFLPSSQRFCRAVEQYRHLPQAGMKEQTTWSPTFTRVTPSPMASTMPAPSWPPTTGKRIIASPFWMWSSEWHSPAAMNLMRTSLSRGSSSSSSVISHGLPGSRQTAARVVMLIGTPSLDRSSAPVHGRLTGAPRPSPPCVPEVVWTTGLPLGGRLLRDRSRTTPSVPPGFPGRGKRGSALAPALLILDAPRRDSSAPRGTRPRADERTSSDRQVPRRRAGGGGRRAVRRLHRGRRLRQLGPSGRAAGRAVRSRPPRPARVRQQRRPRLHRGRPAPARGPAAPRHLLLPDPA